MAFVMVVKAVPMAVVKPGKNAATTTPINAANKTYSIMVAPF